jgi:hypothetical protein
MQTINVVLVCVLLSACVSSQGQTTSADRPDVKAWGVCVFSEAQRLAISSQGSASEIADAALASCKSKEVAFIIQYNQMTPGSVFADDMQHFEDSMRQQAIGVVLRNRS